MRPSSIITFERAYLFSLFIGLIESLFTWGAGIERLEASPEFRSIARPFMIVVLVAGFGIGVLLWYLVARRASTITKWFLVVLTVIGVAATLIELSTGGVPLDATLVVSLVATALTIFAVIQLFRPDAIAWLRAGGRVTDAEVFR